MARTYQQIMDEAREVVPEVSPDDVKSRIEALAKPVVLDVREREEYRQGFLPGAVSIPRGFLELRLMGGHDVGRGRSRRCKRYARNTGGALPRRFRLQANAPACSDRIVNGPTRIVMRGRATGARCFPSSE